MIRRWITAAVLALAAMPASSARRPDPLIIPRPKVASFRSGEFRAPDGLEVAVDAPAREGRLRGAVRSLAAELGVRWNVRASRSAGAFTRIRIGRSVNPDLRSRLLD